MLWWCPLPGVLMLLTSGSHDLADLVRIPGFGHITRIAKIDDFDVFDHFELPFGPSQEASLKTCSVMLWM